MGIHLASKGDRGGKALGEGEEEGVGTGGVEGGGEE